MSISQELEQLQNQFRMLHNRYKNLVVKSDDISSNLGKKQVHINIFNKELETFKTETTVKLKNIKQEIQEILHLQKNVSRKFSNIVKQGRVNKIQSRIDNQDYENLVSRKQFIRMVKQSL